MEGIDQAKVSEFVERVQSTLLGAATSAMTALGDRLGLYRELAANGPATSAELADRTGCAERYLGEWLAQQAAVGFVAYDADTERFALAPEHAFVLATDESPVAFAGAFEGLVGWYMGLERIEEAFRSGDGVGWSEHDPRVHRGTARFFGGAYRSFLLDEWVPALGLDRVLERGARVADVGCGHGESTVLLAEAFERSEFVGFDAHEASIGAARERAAEAGVEERVRFEVGDATGLDGGPYDVIWFFDAFHDLGDPVAAAASARANLASGGAVALVEPLASDEMSENLAVNPVAGLHYTASTLLCVPSALAQPGGMALGAQAGGRALADVLREGGLSHTREVHTTPVHAVYEARP